MIPILIRNAVSLIFIVIVLAGCATKMTDEDRFLWNANTNAPAAQR
jgi:hypothetical protein